jgi:hypothetical protein
MVRGPYFCYTLLDGVWKHINIRTCYNKVLCDGDLLSSNADVKQIITHCEKFSISKNCCKCTHFCLKITLLKKYPILSEF